MYPTFSLVIEWENARLSESDRALEMLRRLSSQILELGLTPPAQPEVILLYNPGEVEPGVIKDAVSQVAAPDQWPADLTILPASASTYYEQKNIGAARSRGEVIIFLDSDVIPEEGWLASLLQAFSNPEVGVVGGNTYIAHEDLNGKAFALFWFFPLRDGRGELRRDQHFFANNVAFRAEVFRAHSFPPLATFRGQCIALAEELARNGVGIYRQERARVSHPAPNGWRHFLVRALCHGHDDTVLGRVAGQNGIALSPLGASKRYIGSLRHAGWTVLHHRREVGLPLLHVPSVLALAGTYYTVKLAGELISCISPRLIRERFSL